MRAPVRARHLPGIWLLLPALVVTGGVGGCAGGRAGGVVAGGSDPGAGRAEACAIARTGLPARAIVLAARDRGTRVDDDPVVDFTLRVLPVEGEAFDAEVRAAVSRLDLARMQPGDWTQVRFDPADRSRVALDRGDCAATGTDGGGPQPERRY